MGLSSTSCRIPAEKLTIAHNPPERLTINTHQIPAAERLTIAHHHERLTTITHPSSSCLSKTMARDINEQHKVNGGGRTIRVRVVFENIILVSTKTVSPDDVKYLQINIQKLPKNRTVTEESSERLYPNTFKDSEIIFNLNSEDASFDFCLTQDAQENASQYEIELEVMRKNELSRIGFFDVQLSDLDMIGSSRKSKWRKISSLHKRFQTIELKYGIFPIQPLNESPKNRKGSGTVISVKELKQNSFEESNPFYTSKIHEVEEKTDSVEMKNNPIPNFQPGSCIMVDIIYKKLQKKKIFPLTKIILRIVYG